MPGICSYTAAINPAFATGVTAGLAADRGYAAPLPAAQAPASNLSLAGEIGQGASRMESQEAGRIFS
jgi:hypothetical protein